MPTDLKASAVLLDTSVVIAHIFRLPKISQRIRSAEKCFLPAIALGELSHGIHKSQRKEQHSGEAANIERFLSITEILYPGNQTADQYGRIIDTLEAQGRNDVSPSSTQRNTVP